MTETESEFFSPTSLAEFLGVPVATVYQWNFKGTGPRFYKIGRHRRFRRSEVERWLELNASCEVES